jgi:MFS family permease
MIKRQFDEYDDTLNLFLFFVVSLFTSMGAFLPWLYFRGTQDPSTIIGAIIIGAISAFLLSGYIAGEAIGTHVIENKLITLRFHYDNFRDPGLMLGMLGLLGSLSIVVIVLPIASLLGMIEQIFWSTILSAAILLAGAFSAGIFFGVVETTQEKEHIETTLKRFRAFYRLAFNGLFMGGLYAVLFGIIMCLATLIVIVSFSISFRGEIIFAVLLFFGLLGILYGVLKYGGDSVIKYLSLRLSLWRAKDAPLNYAEFLNYTTERGLTRQIGGGFVFRHQLLMDHFANLE